VTRYTAFCFIYNSLGKYHSDLSVLSLGLIAFNDTAIGFEFTYKYSNLSIENSYTLLSANNGNLANYNSKF
jgi:hypothetical protein